MSTDAGSGLPKITREGARGWIDAPIDSPYFTRLNKFGAHFDHVTNRWWVGIAKAQGLEDLMRLPLGSPVDEPVQPSEPTRPAAAVLVDMALENYQLGVTDTGEPYGTSEETPHLALMLRGGKTGLRAELARRYWNELQLPAPQQAISDACLVMEGLAAQEDPQRVYLRVAEHAGHVYIDMGDTDGNVIEICNGTWDMGIRAPVLFRRTKLTAAMPKPFFDGDYSKLWKLVPVHTEDRPLVLAWLVQTLIQPDSAHPVLAFFTEHGCGKTTAARSLVALVDPSAVPTRKVPRDSDAWATAANASWVVALDNLSGEVPLWLSDSLCRAVTGDGDVRRALYTDMDVSIMAYRRAIILTGVDVQVTQGDLADRLLRAELPRIENRASDEELANEWSEAYPEILGGLLTLAAKVHHRLSSTTVSELPRMADYAHVLATVDAIIGTDGMDRYREQAQLSAADTLDSPFIAAMEAAEYGCEDKAAKEILTDLTPRDDWKPPKGWPATSRAVTAQLTRHAPALRSQGWHIENDGGHNKRNRTQWTIRQPEKVSNPDSPPSPSSPAPQESSSGWVSEGESEGESTASQTGSITRDNSSPSPDSPAQPPLTSSDESASQASHEYGPHLAHSSIQGGLTDHTPGQTDRVAQALANARSAQAQPVCIHCGQPCAGGQKDDAGRYAHLSCQQQTESA